MEELKPQEKETDANKLAKEKLKGLLDEKDQISFGLSEPKIKVPKNLRESQDSVFEKNLQFLQRLEIEIHTWEQKWSEIQKLSSSEVRKAGMILQKEISVKFSSMNSNLYEVRQYGQKPEQEELSKLLIRLEYLKKSLSDVLDNPKP